MKKACLILLLLVAYSATGQVVNAPLPDSVKAHLHKTLTLIETYSLERKTIDWPQLRQSVYQKAQGTQTIQELMPIYSFVFEKLKDDHGWVTYQGKSYKWNNAARPAYANAVVKAELAKKPGIQVKILPNNIGYIRLPGINAGGSLAQQQAAAQVVRDSVCRINSDKITAWIIDLRLNDGGAMAPMLGGIAPLIGDGHLGGFVDKEGKAEEQWYLKEGNFYLDTLAITNLADRCPSKKTDKPIAVLISGMTASSGEIVAISLKGRPATQFFGEPTYGATTANTSYQISGSSYLTIAGSVDADRRGVTYKVNVTPDVAIANGDNFADLLKDAKVRAALEWLETAKRRKTNGALSK